MQALRLIEDGRLQLEDLPEPGEPAAGEVIVRMRTVALNHIDLWGFRGMSTASGGLYSRPSWRQARAAVTVGVSPMAAIPPIGCRRANSTMRRADSSGW